MLSKMSAESLGEWIAAHNVGLEQTSWRQAALIATVIFNGLLDTRYANFQQSPDSDKYATENDFLSDQYKFPEDDEVADTSVDDYLAHMTRKHPRG